MIQQSTINAVYPLADMLKERGIKVSALPTTPVAQLLQACHYELPTGVHGEEDFDPETVIQKGSMTQGPDGVVRHDVVMEELVEVIAETVKGNLHVARNVVNPIIKEVVADLQEHMQIAENQLQSNVTIVPDFYEGVWNSPALDAMVDRYAETSFHDIRLTHQFPLDQDTFTVADHVHTGSASFDEDIDALLTSKEPGYLWGLFSRIFGAPGTRQGQLNNVIATQDRDDVLLIHLMARRLMDNPPEGTSLTLSAYNAYVADIVSQTGRALSQRRTQRQRALNQNLLVVNWPQGREHVGKRNIEIKVNGDLYNRFLEEGGSPEVIIGAFISDQPRQTSVLLEKKEQYEKAWEKHHRILITSQRLNRFNHGVEGLRQAIAFQINEMDEEDLIVPRELLHKKLEENLSSLYGHWYEKPYEYARKVICQTLFPHTMSLQILCAIDHVCEDHPGIEVREAALLATIEVVASWVAKLCTTERCA